MVTELLEQYLSPEQVAGYLLRHYKIRISHETIDRYIYSNPQRKKALKKFLHQGHKLKRKAYGSGARASRTPNRTPICERPKIVEQKKRIGDWECGTIFGSDRKNALITVVERKSLFTLKATVEHRKASQVSQAMIRILKYISRDLYT